MRKKKWWTRSQGIRTLSLHEREKRVWLTGKRKNGSFKESKEQVERIQRGEGEFYLYLKRFMRIPAFIRKIAMRFPSRSIDFLQKRHGNFVITNFGSFGVAGGVPTTSMPMIAVLTLGAMQERAVRDAAGQRAFRKFIPVTLLFDHRPIDGAYGGRFLTAMRELMEQRPEALFGE
jgi:hypothetical protein